MSLDHLWAGWRAAYVSDLDAHTYTDGSGTLFERILNSGYPDDATFIVHRGEHAFVILNRYPYGTGHLLVLPKRGAPMLEDLTDAEKAEIWQLVERGSAVLQEVYGCDGINIGLNIGKAAGAGVPDHIHAHVVPRWSGDTNFTTAVAELKVLPESLDQTWHRITTAW